MADGGKGSQELMIEGRVVGLGVRQLPGEEPRGDQDCCTRCWITPPTCVSEATTAREIGAPGMGCTRIGVVKRLSLARQKAASRGGVKSNSLPGPLRALVRGARINTAFLINFL